MVRGALDSLGKGVVVGEFGTPMPLDARPEVSDGCVHRKQLQVKYAVTALRLQLRKANGHHLPPDICSRTAPIPASKASEQMARGVLKWGWCSRQLLERASNYVCVHQVVLHVSRETPEEHMLQEDVSAMVTKEG